MTVPAPVSKRWLFHGILSDTPSPGESEGFYSEKELHTLFSKRDIVPGVRISGLRLTPLPERRKNPPNPSKPPENPTKTS